MDLNIFSDFLNLYSDEWLRTRQATVLFLLSTIYLLGLTVMLLWERATSATHSEVVGLVRDTAGTIGAVAGFFLWFGMLRYSLRLERSSKWTHRLWLIIMILGIWIGTCLYCLAVYLPAALGQTPGKLSTKTRIVQDGPPRQLPE